MSSVPNQFADVTVTATDPGTRSSPDNDPSSSCYILVLPDERESPITIPFQIMPDRVTDSKTAEFDSAFIIGRSSPLKTYKYSSARRINLTLEFFASLNSEDLAPNEDGANNVKTHVNNLRALVNPNYGSSVIRRPKKCLVRLGNNVAFVGFCTNVSVSYRGDYPWSLNPTKAHYASVALAFEDTGEEVYSSDDILSGKDFMDANIKDTNNRFNSD